MTTHGKNLEKIVVILRPHSDPRQRKIRSFMFHFHKPTMVEFFLAIFWRKPVKLGLGLLWTQNYMYLSQTRL